MLPEGTADGFAAQREEEFDELGARFFGDAGLRNDVLIEDVKEFVGEFVEELRTIREDVPQGIGFVAAVDVKQAAEAVCRGVAAAALRRLGFVVGLAEQVANTEAAEVVGVVFVDPSVKDLVKIGLLVAEIEIVGKNGTGDVKGAIVLERNFHRILLQKNGWDGADVRYEQFNYNIFLEKCSVLRNEKKRESGGQ